MDIQPLIDSGSEAAVAKALDRIGDIATLPEITLKIVETVEDPRSTARDLHEIVTHDLALSARILRVVNSAFYGLPGQVASIERAIVMLGLNAVKNIAIAASLSRVFRGGRISRRYTARDLWIHSVAVGTAAKMIVEQLRMPLPDEAFVGGLIHDIGLVVMLQSDAQRMVELMRVTDDPPADFGFRIADCGLENSDSETRAGEAQATQSASPNPHPAIGNPQSAFRNPQWATASARAEQFAAMEKRLFGAEHEAFGAGLARRWKFPRSFQYVTGYHHRPAMLARENRLLTQVVAVADTLCAELEIGLVVPVDSCGFDSLILGELNLGKDQLSRCRDNLSEQVDLAMGLFN